MNLIPIDDPGDPRVAAYANIRERDLVGRQGRFIAEGKVVLRVLLESLTYQAESVFVLKRRLPGLAGLLASRPELPVFTADDTVMSGIAGFPMHRGIMAIGRRPEAADFRSLIAALPGAASLVAVCVGISNHDNIGSIFRNAAAFGCSAVLLDPTCCDPLYRKALRVSVGGVLKVPFARFEDLSTVHEALSAAGYRQFALSPRGEADIAAIEPGGRAAIYLGSEGDGLPADLMARLSTVRIAMAGGFDSVNVAAASAIAMHRLMNPSATVD